jgi:hypothetical protein
MKYGIRAVPADPAAHAKYVSSTRHRRPDLSDDITDIAMFVQEKSAVDAVKTIRRDGAEPEGHTLEVVEVGFSVFSVTQVPYPKAKTGVVLVAHLDAYDRDAGEMRPTKKFFTGSRKPGANEHYLTSSWGNYERATTFPSPAAARARLADVQAAARLMLADEEADTYRHRGYHRPGDEARFKRDHDEGVAQAKRLIDQLDGALTEEA